jgi:hypothetical protein
MFSARVRIPVLVAVLGGLAGAFLFLDPGLAASRPPRGEKYAFLVACGEYDAKELRPLTYTRNDITAFRDVLRQSGFPEGHIVLMHDKQDRRYLPEAAKIRMELKLLLGSVDAGDTMVVALSGHGVQFRGEKNSYFCPVDARLAKRATLLSLEEVYKDLEGCRAARKLLLVDACRNDPQSKLARGRQEVELESVTRPQTQAVPTGIVALFSCDAGQESFEYPDLGHGIFFYHVLQGWKGKASREGPVTLDHLASYVRKETRTFARQKLGVLQVPVQRGEFSGDWVLADARAEKPDPGEVREDSATASFHQTAAFTSACGLNSTEYQAWFDRINAAGYRPVHVNGFGVGSRALFAAVAIRDDSKVPWAARHNQTPTRYQATFDDYIARGYRSICVSGYRSGEDTLMAGIWVKDDSPIRWEQRHRLTLAEYQALIEDRREKGLSPVFVSGYPMDTSYRFCVILSNEHTSHPWLARHDLTATQYQQLYDDLQPKGYRPLSVSGYHNGDQTRFAVIFVKDGGPSWVARNQLSSAAYQRTFDGWTAQGYHPLCVCGYPWGENTRTAGPRYAAVWVKP